MPEPTYAAIHGRLNKHRGLAKQHPCIDCGHPARDWSYNHQDANEITRQRRVYSLDIQNYDPRCKRCHRLFDQRHRRAKRAALRQVAASLEPQIRAAIIKRNHARKANDLQAVDYWDDELERITASLREHADRTA